MPLWIVVKIQVVHSLVCLLDLLAILGHQSVLLVRRLFELDTASGDKGPDQVQVANFLDQRLLLVADAFLTLVSVGLDTLFVLVNSLPEGFKLE